ncbi:MAG: hypothetical protein LAP86_08825 [Acidobacteriia bacterium]|nr:hypothetical protein [Terriglobia bacterium]
MGIVVDLANSDAHFEAPTILTSSDLGFNQFVYDMPSWAVSFAIKFDPDPNKGIGGAPQDSELWEIGIVQNLLFERILFEYSGVPVFSTEFTAPTVDILDNSFDRPFYSSPELGPNRRKTRAVTHIWYSSQGYGELLDPSSTSGVRVNNMPNLLDMWDQPSGGVLLRRNGSLLNRVEKVLCFQTWLVARKKGLFSLPAGSSQIKALRDAFIPALLRPAVQSTIVLAHVPAFTLTFWLTITGPGKGFVPTPTFDYGVYGENGFLPKKRINHAFQTIMGPLPSVSANLGDGGRFPITIGRASAEQARNWLSVNGLAA